MGKKDWERGKQTKKEDREKEWRWRSKRKEGGRMFGVKTISWPTVKYWMRTWHFISFQILNAYFMPNAFPLFLPSAAFDTSGLDLPQYCDILGFVLCSGGRVWSQKRASTIRVPAVPVQINGLGAVIETLPSGLHSGHVGLLHPLPLRQGGLAVGVWWGLSSGGAVRLAVGDQLAAQLVHLVKHCLQLGAGAAKIRHSFSLNEFAAQNYTLPAL